MTESGTGAKSRLAELLGKVPAMADDRSRHAILAKVQDDGFDLSAAQAGNIAVMCWDLIDIAAPRAGALQSLAAAVGYFDKSVPASGFAAEVAELLPSEFFMLDARARFVAWIAEIIPPASLPMYYQLATGDEGAPQLADADDLIRALEDCIFDEERSHPLIVLAHQAGARTGRRQAKQQARDWCRELAGLLDATDRDGMMNEQARLSALWKKHVLPRRAVDAECATLTVQLDPYVPKPGVGYLLRAWLYCGGPTPVRCWTSDEPAKLDIIRREVIGQLRQVIRQLHQPGVVPDITLEFFLPRALLDHPVEEWVASEPHVTLGTEFVVVVRDRDRLYDEFLWRRWQEKWNRVARSKPGQNGPFSQWITCADTPCGLGELHPKLGHDIISLGLTFPPHPLAEGRHELSEALTAGTPVVVWPRTRCQHPHPAEAIKRCPGLGFQTRLAQEFSGKRLTDLPTLVRQMRKAQAANGQVDAGLALLWDDADRRPPTAKEFQLDAPQYLGDA